MMLMIRENDLETVLAKRRNFIGIAPRLESALTIITGVFYVASAVVMDDLWWKIPMYVLGPLLLYMALQESFASLTPRSSYSRRSPE